MMTKPDTPLSRADRLAARLRDNLHRRKAQARAIDQRPDSPALQAKSDLSKPEDER